MLPLVVILLLGSRLESAQGFHVALPMAPSFSTLNRQCTSTHGGMSRTTTTSSTTSPLRMARMGGGGGGRGRPRAPPVVDPNRPVMNGEITATELRVITPNPKGKDEALGIMSRDEALQRAVAMGNLDLILVNNNSDPPVCKIVDYSKYRYMLEKKAKEVKKNSKASELKEIKMSYKIDVQDYDVRKSSCAKFLKQGNRVKCTVMFRGREVQHDKLGFDLLAKLALELDDICVREQSRPQREGRNLSWILTPRPEVLKLVNEQRRAMDKAKKQKKLSSLQETDDDEDDDDDDKEDDNSTPAAKIRVEKTLEEILGTDEYL